MKMKIVKYLTMNFIIGFLLTAYCFAAEENTQKRLCIISEMSEDGKVIQVKDDYYLVEDVYIYDVRTKDQAPRLASSRDLEMGKIVMLICSGEKKNGTLIAETVIMYTGKKKKEIIEDLKKDGLNIR